MCNAEQHEAVIERLDAIHHELCVMNARPFETTIQISANNPFLVDYRNYKHIFCWIPNALPLTLTIDDLGTVPLTVNEWNNISFPTGAKLYAKGQTNLVPLTIRWTNEVIA